MSLVAVRVSGSPGLGVEKKQLPPVLRGLSACDVVSTDKNNLHTPSSVVLCDLVPNREDLCEWPELGPELPVLTRLHDIIATSKTHGPEMLSKMKELGCRFMCENRDVWTKFSTDEAQYHAIAPEFHREFRFIALTRLMMHAICDVWWGNRYVTALMERTMHDDYESRLQEAVAYLEAAGQSLKEGISAEISEKVAACDSVREMLTVEHPEGEAFGRAVMYKFQDCYARDIRTELREAKRANRQMFEGNLRLLQKRHCKSVQSRFKQSNVVIIGLSENDQLWEIPGFGELLEGVTGAHGDLMMAYRRCFDDEALIPAYDVAIQRCDELLDAFVPQEEGADRSTVESFLSDVRAVFLELFEDVSDLLSTHLSQRRRMDVELRESNRAGGRSYFGYSHQDYREQLGNRLDLLLEENRRRFAATVSHGEGKVTAKLQRQFDDFQAAHLAVCDCCVRPTEADGYYGLGRVFRCFQDELVIAVFKSGGRMGTLAGGVGPEL